MTICIYIYIIVMLAFKSGNECVAFRNSLYFSLKEKFKYDDFIIVEYGYSAYKDIYDYDVVEIIYQSPYYIEPELKLKECT